MARTNKDRWFVIGAAMFLAACQTSPKPLATPTSPEETLETRFIYPQTPVIIDFENFKRSLNQLSGQLTVLSLIGPGVPPVREGIENFQILTEVQKQYFRYGVQVMLVDLRSPAGWPEMKNNLQQVNANFPAVYYPLFQAGFLISFLHIASLEGYHLFIIDKEQILNVPLGESLDGPRFKERIKQILQKKGQS
jgi:hypothetical protein